MTLSSVHWALSKTAISNSKLLLLLSDIESKLDAQITDLKEGLCINLNTTIKSNESDKNKVNLILNEVNPNSFQSVPDPYYGGDNGFQDVYDILDEACDRIVEKIG